MEVVPERGKIFKKLESESNAGNVSGPVAEYQLIPLDSWRSILADSLGDCAEALTDRQKVFRVRSLSVGQIQDV